MEVFLQEGVSVAAKLGRPTTRVDGDSVVKTVDTRHQFYVEELPIHRLIHICPFSPYSLRDDEKSWVTSSRLAVLDSIMKIATAVEVQTVEEMLLRGMRVRERNSDGRIGRAFFFRTA